MADNIFIRVIDLPVRINAMITVDEDGNYNIYINERLSYDEKRKALKHELAHARLNHFSRDITVAQAEREAQHAAKRC